MRVLAPTRWMRRRKALRRRVATLLVALVHLVASAALAAEITVKLDSVKENNDGDYVATGPGPFKDKFGAGFALSPFDDNVTSGKFRDVQFEKFAPFNTGQLENGILLTNSTRKKITDFHLKLLGADTFKVDGDGKPVSTGGNAFPNMPAISADKKELTFAGGDLAAGKVIWADIPQLDDNKYSGKITPAEAKKAPKKEKEGTPRGGNDATGPGGPPRAFYDSDTGTLSIDGGVVNLVEPSGAGMDPVVGSSIIIETLQLLGESPELSGAFAFSDVTVHLEAGSTLFLIATLSDVILIPDDAVPGFDSLLQGSLVWEQAWLASGSAYLAALYGPGSQTPPTAFFFRSNLLSETDDGMNGPLSSPTPPSGSLGTLSLGAVAPASIPAVSTLSLLALALLILTYGTILTRQRGRRR